ncbi:hypothetical protein EUGRSUZ_G00621 [Eucalyptus grandis]|uniref:Uncharacterized protein n=2 Tax=Eucalyptus grandis TaxID=71139 RepID=A0ACC3K060_EUCGR|nr:hypothetical protein EUGRSUZ_G00621 [Eucalyptus grandis]
MSASLKTSTCHLNYHASKLETWLTSLLILSQQMISVGRFAILSYTHINKNFRMPSHASCFISLNYNYLPSQ